MTQFELHADYDRNGRLTADASEHDQRREPPGASIVPNVDRDDRTLPTKPADGPLIRLDHTMKVKLAQDREPAPVRVREITPPATGCQLRIRASGPMSGFTAFLDGSRRILQRDNWAREAESTLTMAGKDLDLLVEVTAFGATPLLERQDQTEMRRLEISLLCVDPSGGITVLDRGLFTIVPLVLLDDLAVADRLYIVEREDRRNDPTVRDVERVAAPAGVRVVRVPPELNPDGDNWLQDQFQIAYCQGRDGPMRLVVHLPRARSDVAWNAVSQNLAPFVQKHFASKNLGLVDDFWRRTLRVTDVTGFPHAVSLLDSQYSLLTLARVFRVRRLLLQVGQDLLKSAKVDGGLARSIGELARGPVPGVIATRQQIGEILKLVRKIIERAKQQPENADQARKDALDRLKKNLTVQVARARQVLPVKNPASIEVPIGAKTRAFLSSDAVDKYLDRLEIIHDSLNYGGNIGCSPPLPDAGRGKVVIGNSPASDVGSVDSDLLQFLLGQDSQLQPLVEIDTSWLQVAHVDEVMAFVPSRKSAAGFAIVRASTTLAQDLLEVAFRLYRSGISANHPHQGQFPFVPLPSNRQTRTGAHPLTMMLRGQFWLHAHHEKAFQPKEPPHIFRNLSFEHAFKIGAPIPEDERYRPGPIKTVNIDRPGERLYPAWISVLEYLQLDDGCNREIEDRFLQPLQAGLAGEFSGIPVLPIPVVYDTVPFRRASAKETAADPKKRDFVRQFLRSSEAFLPNASNLQVLNGRVMVPRPFGPRMRFADAAAVLTEVMPRHYEDLKIPGMTPSYFRARNLHSPVVWLNRDDDDALANWGLQQVAKWFRDGFDESLDDEKVSAEIRRANPGRFKPNGRLKDGWQRVVIPENTVDLFEACIQIVFESVGATVHFVDSWFYHVRGGEVHCATNVLRRPRS